MTLKQWSAWLLAAGITTLIAVVSIDFEGGGTDMGTASISLANMTKAQKDSVVRAEISRAKAGDEIVSLRNENSKITKISGNKFNAAIHTSAQNYLDKTDSIWKSIDLTVKEVSALAKLNPLRKFDKYVDAGNYRATWFDNKPHDYTFYEGDISIEFECLSSLDSITIKTESTTSGMKQTYTIQSKEAASILQWKLITEGKVSFSDGKLAIENTNIRVTQPTATDAKGFTVPVVVQYDELLQILTYQIDTTNALYPIVVDPTVTLNVSSDNETGYGYGRNADYMTARSTEYSSNNTVLQIGENYSAGLTLIFRCLLKFDTSTLPDNAVIDSTKLKMVYSYQNYYANFDMRLCKATSVWSGDISGYYTSFVGFNSGGAHTPTYLSDDLNNTYYRANGDSTTWNFNSDGKSAINKTSATCMYVISSKDISATSQGANNYEYFQDDTPYLQIWYQVPPNAPTNFTNTAATTTTLKYSWTDNSSDESGFKIKNAGGDTLTVGTYAANQDTGTVIGLGINTPHGLRVFAYNVNGWSAPSDSVVKYTLANPATSWAFTGASTTSIAPAFEGNSNPAGTLYAIRDSTRSKWISATGDSASTKTWRTETQWEAITITGLSINTQYQIGVVGKNGDEVETAYLWGTVYTLAAIPGLPSLTALSPFSIRFIIAPENNPSYTQFALQDSITGFYVDGSAEPETLRVGPPGDWGWKTFSQWGGVQGDTLTGLLPDSLYVIRVKARTGE